MEALIDYLLQFGDLNKQQIDLVKSKGVPGEIKKDAYYHEAGTIAREGIFLTKGVMRFIYYKKNPVGRDILRSRRGGISINADFPVSAWSGNAEFKLRLLYL